MNGKRISQLKGLIITGRSLIRRVEREGGEGSKSQLERLKRTLARHENELSKLEESSKYIFTIYVGNGL
jgi:hypothetical protein